LNFYNNVKDCIKMHFQYLDRYLYYYDCYNNQKLFDKITNEYKQYKLDFLKIGINNDIDDFIKCRIESVDNDLSILSIKKFKKINKKKYINEFQRENDIQIMNNRLYYEFEEFKKILEKWKSYHLNE